MYLDRDGIKFNRASANMKQNQEGNRCSERVAGSKKVLGVLWIIKKEQRKWVMASGNEEDTPCK